MLLRCKGKTLDLSVPRVMGVLNVTPDSFSDGGQHLDPNAAIDRVARMVAEGAAIVDIGGESTRPGAQPVSAEQELARVVPVIEAVVARFDVVVSIDTSKPEVMRAATQAGAALINDVRALRLPGALEAAAESGAAVCLMHMQGEPGDMQRGPAYENVISDVTAFLRARSQACVSAGMSVDTLLVDPGFGFGKSLEHNLTLLRELGALLALGLPVLVGLSRKSMLGALVGTDPGDRVAASVAAATLAVWNGACVVRAHDVAATVQALAVCNAVKSQ